MHTFNLGFVFAPVDNVIIIVCASEDPIDRQEVMQISQKYFNQGMAMFHHPVEVMRHIIKGIKEECGCEAVMVNADCACLVHRK